MATALARRLAPDLEVVVLEAGPPALHVVFFATWCPVCVDELDRLARLYRDRGNAHKVDEQTKAMENLAGD